MKYQILDAQNREQLQKSVQAWLDLGWEALGAPFIDAGGWWHQAVTKPDISKPGEIPLREPRRC